MEAIHNNINNQYIPGDLKPVVTEVKNEKLGFLTGLGYWIQDIYRTIFKQRSSVYEFPSQKIMLCQHPRNDGMIHEIIKNLDLKEGKNLQVVAIGERKEVESGFTNSIYQVDPQDSNKLIIRESVLKKHPALKNAQILWIQSPDHEPLGKTNIETINNHFENGLIKDGELVQNAKAYIHCMAGKGRSAEALACYFLKHSDKYQIDETAQNHKIIKTKFYKNLDENGKKLADKITAISKFLLQKRGIVTLLNFKKGEPSAKFKEMFDIFKDQNIAETPVVKPIIPPEEPILLPAQLSWNG